MRSIFASLLIFSIVFLSLSQAQGVNPNPDTSYLDIGGALRFNGFYKNWKGQEANRLKGGDIDFDTWRINVDGGYNDFTVSAEYRFYRGYNMLKHGWIGYDFSQKTQLQVGVNKVPFGLLPYASHNWFESLPYYMGLEDDYDAGIKLIHKPGNWDLRAAFYKNSEGSYSGSSAASARYSYDVIGENEEVNQGNLRIAYNFGNTEIGISGQYGQLFNHEINKSGDHYALAAHLEGNYGPFNLKAEAIKFGYQPVEKVSREPFILMGAYDFPYQVAKRGMIYVGGLSYKLPVDWGPVEALTFYNDFSYFDKHITGFNDAQMNVVGVMVEAGPVYTYIDVASGQSHPWIGPVWSEALARGPAVNAEAGDPKPEWATRFNINIGYYF